MTPSDDVLVRQTLGGDADSFDQLMLRYQKLVCKVALGYVRNKESALDVTQNVFLNAYRKLDNVIYAAPDLDIEVSQQRNGPARVYTASTWTSLYISPNDRALGTARQSVHPGLARRSGDASWTAGQPRSLGPGSPALGALPLREAACAACGEPCVAPRL